jgi:hypothetical protein
VLFGIAASTGLKAAHSDVLEFLWSQIGALFLVTKLLEVSELVGVGVETGEPELLFFVIKDIFGSEITDFFPVLVHEGGGFGKGEQQLPEFGLGELLVVDAFFAVGNLAFKGVGEVVIYDLSA